MPNINIKIIHLLLNKMLDILSIALHIGKFALYLFGAFFFLFGIISFFIGGEWLKIFLQSMAFFIVAVLIEIFTPIFKTKLKKVVNNKIQNN